MSETATLEARALELLRELEAERAARYISPYDIAIVHAGLGDRDAALRELRRAVDDRSAWMVFLEVDPRLDGLRDELGFRQVLDRLR